jgi:hypothetical protein
LKSGTNDDDAKAAEVAGGKEKDCGEVDADTAEVGDKVGSGGATADKDEAAEAEELCEDVVAGDAAANDSAAAAAVGISINSSP